MTTTAPETQSGPRPRGSSDQGSSSRGVVRRLPRPRTARALATDLWIAGGFIAAVTVGLWINNGGLALLLAGGLSTISAIGQVTGLAAALAAMGALILTSRPRWLERRFGQDSLVAAHRWFGIVTMTTLVVHVVADSWTWLPGGNPVTGLIDLVANEPWMVAALMGTIVFLAIGLTSYRRIRQRIPYETWYFIHLTAYLAVLLGFAHQITLGSTIAPDLVALVWWWVLAIGTTALVLWSRLTDVIRTVTGRFYVTAVSREADGIGSVHVSGPGLARLRVAGGQFFQVRPLTRDLWWQAHPYSLSAAPTTAGLRFTVKELGDGSQSLLQVKPGTRVMLEGPYGAFTIDQAQGAPVVLVAGGVGISPIRALLEDCRPEQAPVVIVRVRHETDVAYRSELERMVAARGGRLHVLAGRREWFTAHDPFSPKALAAWIPDIKQRHVFVCGPTSLEEAALKGMRKAGVPAANIHHERFGV